VARVDETQYSLKCPKSPHKGRGNNHHSYYRKANITCAISISSSEEDNSSWMLKHTTVCAITFTARP
jgi:hypothetical protein